jgi:UDP-N-acetyl-D-glucosamine dehydrogenase
MLAGAFYRAVVDEVEELTSCRAAEMAKLLENTFRMVNIALVNELATICAAQGLDVWEVIRAAATKPFGFMPFYPGPGVGGHCIPLDPTYLSWQSRKDTGRPFRLVELAQDINAQMPTYVAARIVDTLNERGTTIKGARILGLGVTYKANVGDVRESAAIEVLAALQKRGAEVLFADPFVEAIDEHGLRLSASEVTDDLLGSVDCVALLTPHDAFDYAALVRGASLVFDARNALSRRNLDSVVTL